MRFMLSMWGDVSAAPAPHPDRLRAMVEAMDDIDGRLRATGELVHDEGFGDPSLAFTVLAEGARHERRFATGEPLIGFWIVDVVDEDRAAEIAAEIAQWSGAVEVRPVGSRPEV
jgi:hypothetical protein